MLVRGIRCASGPRCGIILMSTRGSPVAWNDFYKTARWQRLRKFQLMQHPLCKFCLARGIVTAAKVVDHVVPHKGDWTAFVTGALQSLCESCHNSAKRGDRAARLSLRCRHRRLSDRNHPFYRAGRHPLDYWIDLWLKAMARPWSARKASTSLCVVAAARSRCGW